MPYFHTSDVNLLFIHIPKTGGTSLECYFASKYNIALNTNALVGFAPHMGLPSSLQHLTITQIIQNQAEFNIDLNQLKIITVVRNPYERTISDLFWFRLINEQMTAEDVYPILRDFVLSSGIAFDMHPRPQYEYLDTKSLHISTQIVVLHTENLTNEMNQLGYDDFDMCISKNKSSCNYYSLLNKDSIQLINRVYQRDFEQFHYKMLLEQVTYDIVTPVNNNPQGTLLTFDNNIVTALPKDNSTDANPIAVVTSFAKQHITNTKKYDTPVCKRPARPSVTRSRTEQFLTPEALFRQQNMHKGDRLLQKRHVKRVMPKQYAIVLAGK